MTKLPEPVIAREECAVSSGEYYTKAQMLQFRRDALDEAIERIKALREGWGDAAEEYRMSTAIIQILELKDET
jgi:hypothetical protein